MCLQGNNSSFAFYHNFSDSCHQMSFLIQYCQSVCFTCLLLIMIIKYKVILFLTFFYPTKQLFSVFKQFSLAWKKQKFLVYFQSILKDKFQIHKQKKFLMTITVVSILSSKYLSKCFVSITNLLKPLFDEFRDCCLNRINCVKIISQCSFFSEL